jgi:hypothetical protein
VVRRQNIIKGEKTMSKIIRYTKITGSYYSDTCGTEYEGDEFDYEVSESSIMEAIVDFLFRDYFSDDNFICASKGLTEEVKERLHKIIEDNYLIDEFMETYEEELKDYFEEEAFEWYGC